MTNLANRLPDDFAGMIHSNITGNDQSARENSQQISATRLHAPFVLRLCWKKTASSKARVIGTFQLNLQALLSGDYIYLDPSGKLRLKIQHDGGEFFIRRRKDCPAVRLG